MSEPLNIYGDVLAMDEMEHAYTWGGKFVPGVTTILKVLDKPALVQWAANMAVEYIRENLSSLDQIDQVCKDAKTAHRRASKKGADIGTEVHKFCQQTLVEHRAAMPTDPQALQGARAFLTWLHSHEIQPVAVERKVMSKKWYYAGTTDFIGRINGERCVLDFKTSNPFKNKWAGPYIEMHLQLAAYAIAIEEELACERINTGWIIRLDKSTGKCEPYQIAITDGTRDCWLRVKELSEELKQLEERLTNAIQQAA